jgi:molybdopterin-guanine dinucleotide biosynthesis protein A
VNATDADEQNTPNANVTYDIQAADVPFVIDTHTGMLAIHGAFDRLKDYAFFVIACDNPDKENDRCHL